MSARRKRKSEEFYVLVDGKQQDAGLHGPILANADAEYVQAKRAVRRAIKAGIDPRLARRVYAYREHPSPGRA